MRRICLAIIVCAVLVGGALRAVRLSSVPPAIYCDEAFHGYEAYSLLETGADSRGTRLPVFFSIFDVGWEEPLYVYLTTIPVSLLGTTEAATRAVAAMAGTLSLLGVAWLAARSGGLRAAAAACALMAVSPWSFHFSRIGFQASLLPLFLAAGAAMLMRGADPRGSGGPPGGFPDEPVAGESGSASKRRAAGWILAGAGTLTASLYTYVAARLLAPLLLAGFAVAFLPRLRRIGLGRAALLGGLITLIAAPVVLFALTPEGRARYQDVGVASRASGPEAVRLFAGNYASYFSPTFLLTEGDPNPRHSVRGFGVLHAHDVLFLVAGVAGAMLRRRASDLFLLWWLAVAPLPAALAADPSHAVRAIGALPATYVLAGCGAAALIGRGGPLDPYRRPRRWVLAGILLASAVSISAYLYHYFFVYPIDSAPAWQYGLKEAYREVETLAASHDSIYVTKMEDFPWIHRLYLFAFPPEEYQRHRFTRTKYLFDEPVFYGGGIIPGRRDPLFLLKPQEVPETGILRRVTVPYPDGTPAFVIAW